MSEQLCGTLNHDNMHLSFLLFFRFLTWFVVFGGVFCIIFFFFCINSTQNWHKHLTWCETKLKSIHARPWTCLLQSVIPDIMCTQHIWCNSTELCSWQGSAVKPQALFDLLAKLTEFQERKCLAVGISAHSPWCTIPHFLKNRGIMRQRSQGQCS